MEQWFLSRKGIRVGRSVKEKSLNRNSMNTSSDIGVSTELDDTMNEDTLVGVAFAIQEGVTPSVSNMMVEKEKICSLKKVNVCTLFTPGGNGIDVVVPVDSIRAVSERFANTVLVFLGEEDGLDAIFENGTWFIRNNPLILKKWHSNENILKEDVSNVPVWVKLYGVPITAFNKDGLSAIATKLSTPLMIDSYTSDMCVQSWAMPKITREGHYTCNVYVEYEWKPLRCSSCKIFGHVHEECPKNTGAGEKKTIRKPSQTLRGVPVGSKNRGTTNLVNNEATSSGSSFMNANNDGEFASNTPIGEKIDKIERQICEGKLRLLDNDGNLLVPMCIVESDSEVDVVFDETANLRISTSGKDKSDKGYVTNSLLEQWRDSYSDNDDYDPYDDDMYKNHDLAEHL
nr:hypothetical protein [Tanacetum cinerariifolium]